jgi:hypothetical protein
MCGMQEAVSVTLTCPVAPRDESISRGTSDETALGYESAQIRRTSAQLQLQLTASPSSSPNAIKLTTAVDAYWCDLTLVVN